MELSEDYCTAVPDGDWGDVCKTHDDDYTFVKHYRKEADIEFRLNLSKHNRVIAFIYYIGVRVFGRLFV